MEGRIDGKKGNHENNVAGIYITLTTMYLGPVLSPELHTLCLFPDYNTIR